MSDENGKSLYQHIADQSLHQLSLEARFTPDEQALPLTARLLMIYNQQPSTQASQTVLRETIQGAKNNHIKEEF